MLTISLLPRQYPLATVSARYPERECMRCHVTKPRALFIAVKKNFDGLYTYCNECVAAQSRVNRAKARAARPPKPVRDLTRKTCCICHETKPVAEFQPHPIAFAGRGAQCKPCRKKYSAAYYSQNKAKWTAKRQDPEWMRKTAASMRSRTLQRDYGITEEDYQRMLAEQGGACAICRTKSPGRRTRFSIDHCHATGKVRGLLCTQCNIGIGYLKDSEERLIAAAAYLRKSREG